MRREDLWASTDGKLTSHGVFSTAHKKFWRQSALLDPRGWRQGGRGLLSSPGLSTRERADILPFDSDSWNTTSSVWLLSGSHAPYVARRIVLRSAHALKCEIERFLARLRSLARCGCPVIAPIQ